MDSLWSDSKTNIVKFLNDLCKYSKNLFSVWDIKKSPNYKKIPYSKSLILFNISGTRRKIW